MVIEMMPKSYRIIVMSDLNGKVGTSTKNGTMSEFDVPGENDNGRRIKDMCNKSSLCVKNN